MNVILGKHIDRTRTISMNLNFMSIFIIETIFLCNFAEFVLGKSYLLFFTDFVVIFLINPPLLQLLSNILLSLYLGLYSLVE